MQEKSISEQTARSVMSRYKTQDVRWHYEHGLVLQSIFLLGQRTEQEEYCSYVKTMFDAMITSEGDILTYKEDEYNLDQINSGKVLFLLHEKYGEEKYRIAIEKLREQLRNHPRTKTEGFWHKQIYPFQMWLDGLYMHGPFYTEYAKNYGCAADFKDIVHQFTLIEEKARDSKTGLLYHAWDESKQMPWSNKETGCSPHFWGRALGWYCMALVDAIELIPDSCPQEIEAVKAIAFRLLPPLLNFQDQTTGLWYQVLDKGGEEKNYLESSASSMYVYFLLKLLRLGLVPDADVESVKTAADKAFQGLLKHKIRREDSGELHLRDICKVAGLGGNPYRDGSYGYYVGETICEDDFKGVGPFILAAMEWEMQ